MGGRVFRLDPCSMRWAMSSLFRVFCAATLKWFCAGFGGLAISNDAVSGTFPCCNVVISRVRWQASASRDFTAAAVVLTAPKSSLVWYLHLPHLIQYSGRPVISSACTECGIILTVMDDRQRSSVFVNFWIGVWSTCFRSGSRSMWRPHLTRPPRSLGPFRRAAKIAHPLRNCRGRSGSGRFWAEQDYWIAAMFRASLHLWSLQLMQGETRRAIPAYRRYRE